MGAKQEGFRTLVVTTRSRKRLYKRFKFIDDHLEVEGFKELVSDRIQKALEEADSVLIPHGTFISEVGVTPVEESLKVPLFGNRHILKWESSRQLKEKLMAEASLRYPKRFSNAKDIDHLCIAKLPGAAGGKGYFLASDEASYAKNLAKFRSRGLIAKGLEDDIYIQEYVIGVPVYLQYFYSPLKGDVELMGVDRRYETNVDALGRIPAKYQEDLESDPTYLVVGNEPLVLRESLLEEVYSMGERFVEASQRLVPPGIIGPFCIEGVYNHEGRFVSFEFSARIVAGTNLFVDGSPYSVLTHGEPISMGRRIAIELRRGLEEGQLDRLLT